MKAQELRIGNWVYVYEDGHNTYTKIKGVVIVGDRKIDGYSSDFVYYDFGSSILTDCDGEELVTPIPLTPEILEKFGFVFEDNKSTRYGWYKRLNKQIWISWCRAEFIHLEDSDSNVLIDIPCSYVHQLQNISYDFTGEELEFKP